MATGRENEKDISQLRTQLTIARNEIHNLRQQIRALGHTHKKDVERLQNMLHSWQCHSCNSSSLTTSTLEDGVSLRPIGVISTWFPEKKGTPRQAGVCVNTQGKLALFNSVFTNPEHALEGLEGFSHMWILYHFHKNDSSHVHAKVSPPRLNGARTGVFGTRSPHRPSPIGLSLVTINRVEGSSVYFCGVDMVDGTPVLDIKPYIPQYDNPLHCRTSDLRLLDGREAEDESLGTSPCDAHLSPVNGRAQPSQFESQIGEREAPDGEEGARPSPVPPVGTQTERTQEARKLSIQRCIQSLVHACQCRYANCRMPSCQKMKRVVQHTKICKRKTNGGCPICKQLIALCCYHAKHCQETKCPVAFCLNIKHKLKQQQLQKRLQQAQLLRRRMAVMNTRSTVPSGALPGNSTTGGPGGVLAGGAVGQAGVMSGQPGAGNMVSLQTPHQPVGSKPGTQTPPANVLQVVKQVQEEAARQQAPHTSYPGKVTPMGAIAGQPQVMPPPQMQRPPLGSIGPSNAHLIPTIDQWRYVPNASLPNTGLRQTAPQTIQQPPQPHLQPNQPAMLTGSHISGPIPPISIRPPPTSVGPAMQKHALHQLLQMLKSPSTPDQQQQILHILKTNPQLMAAFIKQRQGSQTQHPQAGQQQSQAGSGHQQQLQHMMSPQQQQQQQGHIVNYPNVGFEPTQYVQQPGAVVAQQVLQQQQPGLKPTPPPVPSPQGAGAGTMMTGPPPGTGSAAGISVQQQQQLMQTVRSPPPIRSPQPNPSPRPVPSPRNQPVPSPRGGAGPVPSPHHHPPPPHVTPTHSPAHHQPDLGGSSEMMLSQLSGGGAGQQHVAGASMAHHPSPAGAPPGSAGSGGQGPTSGGSDPNDMPPMTPQDKLSKFVEQL